MKVTTATDQQQQAVASMINSMMNPTQKPDGGSFTLGWDIVVSYSEDNINQLLATRHAKTAAKMLKDVQISFEDTDPRTDEPYTVRYDLKFGPPQIQFNARNTMGPTCSLTMRILSGTRQFDDGDKKQVPPGFSLTIAGIPLGTATGRIKDGTVQATQSIDRSSKTIQFDYDSNEQKHVVLNLPLASTSMVISCLADDPKMIPKAGFSEDKFQKAFKKYFLDTEKVNALSYSLASINNDSPTNGVTNSLEPTYFQFACFTKGKSRDDPARTPQDAPPITSLSMFIQTKTGNNTGTREDLQSHWQSQWSKNNAMPIPHGFSASLILSPYLVYKAMLEPGFKSSSWTTEVVNGDGGISMKAKNSGTFSSSSQTVKYSNKSSVWLDSFKIELKDYPLEFHIKQSSGRGQPELHAKWHMQTDVDWQDDGKFLDIGFLDTKWGDGKVRLHYWLSEDANNHDKSQRLDKAVIHLDDREFKLDIKLNSANWHMTHEQTPGSKKWYNNLDWPMRNDVWTQVMGRVKDLKPNSTISGVGLEFLRTTNLLSPNQEVIDFNEGIGLKCPRDFVLVGDVLPS